MEELKGHEELKQQVSIALSGVQVDSVAEIPAKIESLENVVKSKEDELANIKLINEKLAEKLTNDAETKISVDRRLSDIKSNISGNAMTATVTSVNTEWGFVVVNKGASNSPITEDSILLVQRGGRYVGKLKIATLESNQSICDLDLADFSGRSLPRPGDRVILRDTLRK